MAVVIADAGPLIALAKIAHLHLLSNLFTEVLVTQAVVDECVGSDTDDARLIQEALKSGILKCVNNPVLTNNLSRSLGIGEQTSIEYALQAQKKLLLVMDDALARKHALHHKLTVVGTAAILFTAQQRALIANAEDLILQLTDAGYRISPIVISQLKQKSS